MEPHGTLANCSANFWIFKITQSAPFRFEIEFSVFEISVFGTSKWAGNRRFTFDTFSYRFQIGSPKSSRMTLKITILRFPGGVRCQKLFCGRQESWQRTDTAPERSMKFHGGTYVKITSYGCVKSFVVYKWCVKSQKKSRGYAPEPR